MALNLNFLQGRKGIALVLATAVISGFSIFINSIGVKEFDSSVFTFLKNIVVAIFLFAVIMGMGSFNELKKLKRKNWLQLFAIGFLGGSIPFLLYFKGLQMTTGATSGFIHKTIFLYASIFAVVFLREKLTKGLFAGAILLLAGNYLLLKPDFNFSSGHLLIVIATIMWAAENTFSKHVLKEIPANVVAFGRMFFGSLLILVFLGLTGKIQLIAGLGLNHVLWIALTSIFLLAYVLAFYNGLQQVKVSTATCILSLGQPITMLLSWIFKNKALSLNQGFGILFILIGIAIVIWFSELSSRILLVKPDGRD